MELLATFYAEKDDWFKYIYKRLNASVGGYYHHDPTEAADEVFINALAVLGEKYSTLTDETIARRTLVTIIRYEVFHFRKKEMNEWWIEHTTPEERATQKPPSTRLHTDYMRVYRKKWPERTTKAWKKYFEAHKDEIYEKRRSKRFLKWLLKNKNRLVDADGLPISDELAQSLIGLPTGSPENQLIVENEADLLA